MEDAQVAMKLYQTHKKKWEAAIRTQLTKREIQERKRERKRRVEMRDFIKKTQYSDAKPFHIMLHTDI